MVTVLISGNVGWIILSKELLNSSTPTNTIKISTINAVIYSILPCPHGWSLSIFFCETLNPIMVTIDEPASVTLFNASEMIEMELANIPMTNFTADSRILTTIPVILESIPYLALVSGFSTFLSFINNFINKFVMFSPSSY